MHELRQDLNHAQYMRLIGWKIEVSPAGIKAYVRPLPLTETSVMKIQRVPWKKLDYDWVKNLAKKYRVITTYIEVDERVRQGVLEKPDNQLIGKAINPIIQEMKGRGFKPLKMGMVSSKTQVIDLEGPETELLKKMKTKTRYNIGLTKKRGLLTKIWTGTAVLKDPEILGRYLKLIKQNNKRVGYWGGQESWIRAQFKAFTDQAYVVAVTDEHDHWLGSSLYLVAGDTSYYAHNGSTERGRKDMAPSLVVWEGMREAKNRGLKYFDFDGVYDERFPVKRWLGYTRFKQGFGGNYVYYPPAFEKWFMWLR